MNEEARLTSVLQGLQDRLDGQLRGSRAAVTHPGARGEAAEDDWLQLLKGHLPNRYQADRAFVISSEGECSEQIDIVIYDRQYSPLLYNQAQQRYVPAESVYAVLEVKQDLSREHVIYAAGKAASVRRLLRTSAEIPYAAGAYDPRPLPEILAGVLTYQSSWNPPLGRPLRDALTELSPESRLDIGCALLDGTFEADYPWDGGCNVTVAPPALTLVQFLLRLLRRLQAMATAPAINYDAYLAQLTRETEVPG